MDDDDKAAIGAFFSAFEKFETVSVGTALRSLSIDAQSVDGATDILDFEARLKLLERMAFARDVPAGLMMELEALLLRARKLHELRDEVARNMASEPEHDPKQKSRPSDSRKSLKARKANFARLAELASSARTASHVEDYTSEAFELQEILRAISERLLRHVAGSHASP